MTVWLRSTVVTLTAARDAFEKALSLKTDEVTAHTYLGIIADHAGDLKEAERHFAAAVKAEPNRASARNNYGAILHAHRKIKSRRC